MRIIIVFLTVFCMNLYASGIAQTVTLSGTNIPLKRVFDEIRKQTGYAVFFNRELLTNTKPVTLQAVAMPLKELLTISLKDQPLKFELSGRNVILSKKEEKKPEEKEIVQLIKGRVVDSLGQPLSGATITVKNSKVSGVTDAAGIFSINVDQGDLLLISYVGYETKSVFVTSAMLAAASNFVITLRPLENKLDEVEVLVNTGYQTLPKERATGSFEVVNQNLLQRQIGTDVISRLDGLVPGILFDKRNYNEQLGRTSQIFQVRGPSTMTSSTLYNPIGRPLIIVDNFPYEGEISNINPDIVESITVLKDAAAASIWGARAGNGVLVITTKKGSIGAREKNNITFTANVNFMEKPDLFYDPKVSTSDFIDNEIFLFGKGVFNTNLGNTTTRPVITPVVEILDKIRKGTLSNEAGRAQIDALRAYDIREEYDRYLYRSPVQQQYALSFTGSGPRYGYTASVAYDKNSTALVRNDYDRLVLRIQNAIVPFKKFRLEAGVTYTTSLQTNNQTGGFRTAESGGTELYPYARLADEQGNHLIVEQNYRKSYIDGAGGGKLLNWYYRPLDELELADISTKRNHFLLNAAALYTLGKNLNMEIRYQFEQEQAPTERYYSPETFYMRNMINLFSKIENGEVKRNIPLGGLLDQEGVTKRAHSGRAQINYNTTFGDHVIHALGGMEIRNSGIDFSRNWIYGYDQELLTMAPIDYITRFETFDRLGGSRSISFMNSSSWSAQRFVSWFGNAGYTYLDRYSFTISGRSDASNLFGVETNNKWKPLWSVGAKWDLDREPFYSIPWLQKLSLRTTYGYSGNVNNSISAIPTIEYNSSLTLLGRLPYAFTRNAPNPTLRWETVAQINFALQFSAFKNSISGSVEYYVKKSTDLIEYVSLDATTGYTGMYENSASMRGKGVDLSLMSANLRGNLKWNTNFFLSYNTNAIVKDNRKPGSSSSNAGFSRLLPASVGYPLNSMYSYQFAGLDPATGDPLGILNGKVSKEYLALQQALSSNLVYEGTALPQYFGSLRNTFDYRQLSLSFNITYRFDYKFRLKTIQYASIANANSLRAHADFAKRWQKPGDELYTTIPSYTYPADSRRDLFYAYSQATVEPADHIRFQDFQLAYSPQLRGALQNYKLKITGYVNNIGILWKATRSAWDPDYTSSPPAKSFALGFQLNF